MSVHAISHVFTVSEAKGVERLVLLVHGDHAHGASPPWRSWASDDLVSHETRATRRGVQKAIDRLVTAGRLIDTGERKGQSIVYEIAIDVAADVADKQVRLDREAKDRSRNRRRANQVRPTEEGPDPAPDGELSSPHDGEPSSPHAVGTEYRQAEQSDACAELSSPEPVGTVRNRTAAKAAAAGEPAEPSSSSTSSVQDVAARFWGDAASMLVAAGFDVVEVEEAELRLKVVLRKHADRLPNIAWDVLALQLREGRAERTIAMWRSVVGTLSFGLSQPVGDHLIDQPTPPSASRGGGAQASPAPVVELKPAAVGSPPARTWTAILADAQRTIGDGSWDSWLSTLVAIETTDEPPTLWVAAPPHARSWIEDRLIPLLSASAQRVSGDHTAEVRLSVGEVPAVYRQDAA